MGFQTGIVERVRRDVPRHIAIIMDGERDGRKGGAYHESWPRKRWRFTSGGEVCQRVGVKVISVYVFYRKLVERTARGGRVVGLIGGDFEESKI